jgi:plasmid maintenance system antidote protein VapI
MVFAVRFVMLKLKFTGMATIMDLEENVIVAIVNGQSLKSIGKL